MRLVGHVKERCTKFWQEKSKRNKSLERRWHKWGIILHCTLTERGWVWSALMWPKIRTINGQTSTSNVEKNFHPSHMRWKLTKYHQCYTSVFCMFTPTLQDLTRNIYFIYIL
jgi:hypothetical protein